VGFGPCNAETPQAEACATEPAHVLGLPKI
jgi:hypothetical protein